MKNGLFGAISMLALIAFICWTSYEDQRTRDNAWKEFYSTKQAAIERTACSSGSVGLSLVSPSKTIKKDQPTEWIIGGKTHRLRASGNYFRVRSFESGGAEIYEATPDGRYVETVASCPAQSRAK
jgi:hypothetical protein